MVKTKHRYILVESSEEFGSNAYKEALFRELSGVIGGIDYHKVNPKFISSDGKRFVVKCSLEGYGKLVVALSMIKELERKRTAFYTIKSSGTIRSLLSD